MQMASIGLQHSEKYICNTSIRLQHSELITDHVQVLSYTLHVYMSSHDAQMSSSSSRARSICTTPTAAAAHTPRATVGQKTASH
jgi:hypothetical protein